MKEQKLTIASFCRLSDKHDPEDQASLFGQYLIANRAGNARASSGHSDPTDHFNLQTPSV